MPREHEIHLENGKLASDSPRSHVTHMVQEGLQLSDPAKFIIHFHGGLVDLTGGRAITDRLAPVYKNAGVYPIFFVWESGFIETLTNNLGELADEKLFRLLWKRLANMVKRKFDQNDSGRSMGQLPASDTTDLELDIDDSLDQGDPSVLLVGEPQPTPGMTELTTFEKSTLEAELSVDLALQNTIHEVSNGLISEADIEDQRNSVGRGTTIRGSSKTLMDDSVIDAMLDRPDPTSRGIISTLKLIKALVVIAARIISRYRKGRDHGFHATIVEEILHEFYVANIGGRIWTLMKEDTADSFGADGSVFGGTALMEIRNATNAGRTPSITLIGHSTGAVYISEWLDSAAALLPIGFKFDIIFLAPASTCAKTRRSLDQHESRIRNFRMFTMKDTKEKDDRLVPVVYPHSLLYFVSGVVEDETDMPLVGMERYYHSGDYDAGEFPDVEVVRQYVGAEAKRSVWSVDNTGPDGRRTASIKHGDFDNDNSTLDSIRHILQSGF